MSAKTAEQWIDALKLVPLPEEGGWYNEVYRSDETIQQAALPARFAGERCFATSIYYLLKSDEFSAFHRIQQEEIWHFYEGSPLIVHEIDLSGNYTAHRLGRDFDAGERFQLTIPRGHLFASSVIESARDSFSLVACSVSPGFEFIDFEAPKREVLLKAYPQHADIIQKLTRE